jgi:hypothetical protein
LDVSAGDDDDVDEAALEKEIEKEGLEMSLDNEIKALIEDINDDER